ncbi:(2,3-dihydroxybenzoyl)adenylate synthase [Shewanella sp. AS16]|uniref:(2,3-dihydroxybenzoyl)adenylate synthase n=1 Tax=Shewanella sp. AS16 TaxID=2907625 RepID=UPI002DD45161|nr:(2,3-dihydroxybenzoyl)adenylate synthase [Shewanella sp. AS16]
MMAIEFTPWPEDLAHLYRQKGYWQDRPLSAILQQQSQARPEAIAIICNERHLSYAELDALSSRLAQALLARGIEQHDTALVQLPNCAEFYILFFALLKIGVAPVNALFNHQRHELVEYARQLQPSLFIAATSHALFRDGQFVTQLRRQHASLSTVLLLQDQPASPHSWDFATHGAEDFWACLTASPVGDPEDAKAESLLTPSAAGQVAFFQLSGGSTGTPKLIPRTHNDYLYSVRRSAEICRLSSDTRFLCALPVGHNFALSSPGALGVFHAGGTLVLAANPEPLSCFHLIAKHRVNMTALVPPAVSLWLKLAETHGAQLASLELLQVGGANFSPALATQVQAKLGCKLQQVFGMAEGLVNYTRLDDPESLVINTQGKPMCDDDELRILDEAGNEVGPGEVGTLFTRGPYTIRGYYLSEQHNSAAFDPQGYYCTGDLVRMTPQGYLCVVGRGKDQINRGGEKIAAEEIEALLVQHKGVRHAALIPIADALMGEKSCAFIVSATTRPKGPELRKFLRTLGVADYKIPDRFEFVDTLPLTAVGKIDKRKLKQLTQTGASAARI